MTERVTKGDVETAVERLNEVAKSIGLDRKFRVQFGSATNGIQHQLAESHPGLSHPTVTKIGPTYGLALSYLAAMRHALESVRYDREYRRENARHAPVRIDLLGDRDANGFPIGMLHDPDARSATRRGQ